MTLTNRRHTFRLLLGTSALAMALGSAHANTDTDAVSAEYKPSIGQMGKDVIWIPTPDALVDHMLRMAEITPQDYLVDLGSGDGRTVITAAQRGTRAHGIEYNPNMVNLARQAAQKAGVADRATFAEGDIFESDFSDATVVTLFLLPELNQRLRPTLLDMKPGTRVVSNSFDMGDWAPDDSVTAGADCKSYCSAYKWIVPAKVEGTWVLNNNTTLKLSQVYQELDGHFVVDGTKHEVSDARLQGARIAFTANGLQYTGQVDGERIVGSDSNGEPWMASRQRWP